MNFRDRPGDALFLAVAATAVAMQFLRLGWWAAICIGLGLGFYLNGRASAAKLLEEAGAAEPVEKPE